MCLKRVYGNWYDLNNIEVRTVFHINKTDLTLIWLIDSGAEAGGIGGIYPPNNWTSSPQIITKCMPPIFLICRIC